MQKKNKFIYLQAGFTLIEIMVVMAIIAILAALSVGSYQSSQVKARDAERKNDLKQISTALEAYYNDKGQYPLNSVDNKINGCANETTCNWGDEWEDENTTIYMVQLPADAKDYLRYHYISDGDFFQLYARLENDLDYDIPTDVGGEPANYTLSCGDAGFNCNYGASSTNITVGQGRTITAD